MRDNRELERQSTEIDKNIQISLEDYMTGLFGPASSVEQDEEPAIEIIYNFEGKNEYNEKLKELGLEIEEEAKEIPAAAIADTIDDDADADDTAVLPLKKTILNYSIKSRLHLASKKTLNYYNSIKNLILSHKGIRNNLSWKQETFLAQGRLIVKIRLQGKTMRLFVALNADDFKDTKYNLKDMSMFLAHKSTPSLFIMKGARSFKHAKEILSICMQKHNLEVDKKYKEQDFKLKSMSRSELLREGLIKTSKVRFLSDEK